MLEEFLHFLTLINIEHIIIFFRNAIIGVISEIMEEVSFISRDR